MPSIDNTVAALFASVRETSNGQRNLYQPWLRLVQSARGFNGFAERPTEGFRNQPLESRVGGNLEGRHRCCHARFSDCVCD